MSSSIEILDPDGHPVNYLYMDATGSDFSTTVGRYYEPGCLYGTVLRPPG